MAPAPGGSQSHAAAGAGVRGALGRLTLLAGVQAFALMVFMLGFFLTRQEVPHHSHCQDAALWKEGMPAAAAVSEEGGEEASACWAPPRFKRAVIVVIDALRFDFVAPVDEGEEDGDDRDAAARAARARAKAKTAEMYHINKLPVVRELLRADPSRALLYRFEADPPTTTMQRLKGLTTGSLPTFLDLRQNFHSPAVAEDSLIQQLRQQDKRLTAMGDDTWQLLFPGAFHRSFPFPSFNTRDLHTVDDGVLQHLLPEMARDDWDVLIAHFLGVDHVGHTFGPSHPAMAAKLGQMDTAIRGVLEALEDDSLLLLMGDHGMTDDGNHGGATKEETEAALFLYSKARPLAQQHADDSSVLLWRDDDDDEDAARGGGHGLTPHHLHGQAVPRRVAQVDLVPTLALLLGTAVPYASLGGIVPELFFHPPPAHTNTNATATVVASYRALARRFRANAAQAHRYLLRYAELASLPQQELAGLSALHDAARAAHDSEGSSSSSSGKEQEGEEEEEETRRRLARACALYRRFLRGALELGRRVWTRYDVGLMLWSLALLAASLLWGLATAWEAAAAEGAATPSGRGVVATAAGSKGHGHARRPPPSPTDLTAAMRWTLAGVGGTLLLSGCFPVHFLQAGNDHAAVVIPALLLTLVLAGLSLPALAARVVAGWRHWRRRQGRKAEDKDRRRQGAGVGVATAVSLALVALHGDSLFSNSFIEAEERVVLFLGVTAAAFAALALSGEPDKESSDSNRGEATSLPSLAQQHLQPLLPGLCTRLAFAVTGHGQDVAAHFHPLATTVPLLALLLGYHLKLGRREERGRLLGLGAAYALVLLHWAAQADDDAQPHSPFFLRLFAPRAIYLGSALALSYPLLARTHGGTAAALCLDLAAAISPALLLVLGPAAPFSLLCQAGAIVALTRLHTHRPHHQSSSSNSSSSRGPPALSLPETVALSFLGRAFFFATGHHTQFSRLQYSAAFVGLDDFDFLAGGALLFLNTFGTELLSLLLVGYYAATLTATAGGDDAQARVTSAVGGLLGLSAMRTFLTSLCVLVQRRHLMVWAIFAPKFIFDAALHVVLSVGGVGLLWALAWRARGGEEGAKKKMKL